MYRGWERSLFELKQGYFPSFKLLKRGNPYSYNFKYTAFKATIC